MSKKSTWIGRLLNSSKQAGTQRKLGLKVESLEAKEVPATFVSFSGTNYSQSFADLGTATSGAIAAAGTVQYLDESPFSTTSSLDGWSVLRVSQGTNSGTTIIAGTGSANTGSLYNFATAAATTDRALGNIRSGNHNATIGVVLQNDTGSSISSITVAFDSEQYRRGGGSTTADRMDFQYQVGVADISAASGWTDVDALDATSVNTSNTAVSAIDGNVAGLAAKSATINLSSPWTAGSKLVLRWTDFDVTSSDDGLAVDNFSLTTGSTTTDVAVAVSPSTTTAFANGTVTYTYTLSNTGTTNITTPFVVDSNTTVTGTGASFNITGASAVVTTGNATVSVVSATDPDLNVTSIDAGAVVTVTYTVTLTGPTSGTGVLDATVSAPTQSGETNTGNNSANGADVSIIQPFTPISYTTAGSNYTQDFNNLFGTVPAEGTLVEALTTLPVGWTIGETGSNANTTLLVEDGSVTNGDSYLFGTAASNERALGGVLSGSLTPRVGAVIVNNSGTTLTNFTLAFTGEQWRRGNTTAGAADTLAFGYRVEPVPANASLTTGSFTSVTALDFVSPQTGATATALDGNLPANQTAKNATVGGIVWQPGQALIIRWADSDLSGSDDGLAVDGVTFSASGPNTDGEIQFDAAAVTVAEDVAGGNLVLTVKRLGDGTGVPVTANFTINNITTSAADYGTPTPTTQVSWGTDDYADKTISIPITNDSLNEGNERFSVVLSGVTGGVATLGAIPSLAGTITDDDFVAPSVRLNELMVDPTDADNNREYVELITTNPTTYLGGVWLLEIEGASPTGTTTIAGTVDRAYDLASLTTGTGGLITLGNDYDVSNPWGITAGATTLADLGTQTFENGATTYLLVTNYTGTAGLDLDTNDDGTLDTTPWGTILDGVSWTGGESGGAFSYFTGASLFLSSGLAPDAVTRIVGSTSSLTADWYAGELIDTGSQALDVFYNTSSATTNLPASGRATPGATNYVAPAAGVFSLDAASYTVAENGANLVITVNRVGTVGAVDVPYTITFTGGASAADITSTTPASPLQFVDGQASTTITIDLEDDALVEGFESFTIALGTPTAGAALGAVSAATVGITDDNSVAPTAGTVLLNEIAINPGSTDNPYEYAEIIGTASSTLVDVYLVGFEGDTGTSGQSGQINYLKPLNGFALGSNGLLVVKSATGGFSIPSGTTVVTDAGLSDGSADFQNGTNTFSIVYSPTPLTFGFDYDAGGTGSLSLPAGASIVDTIGRNDGDAGDFVYGGVTLTNTPTLSVEAATRLRGDTTPNTAASWWFGTMTNTTGATSYSAVSTNAPTTTPATTRIITPGVLNYPNPAGYVQFTASTLSYKEDTASTITFINVARVGGTTGTADVTWTITTPSGGAVIGTDFTVNGGSSPTGTLSWGTGIGGNQTITIELINDTAVEPNEPFVVTLSNPVNADIGAPDVLTFTIVDNDVAYAPIDAQTTQTLSENWSTVANLVNNDEWNLVPSIRGYRGDALTAASDVDPQTVLAPAIASTDVPFGEIDVNASTPTTQLSPETFFSGGVTEFETVGSNPTIALTGSGTADAPFILLHVDATNVTTGIRVQYNVRDLELADNANQQVALQYRIGETGDFINVPGGYIADATDATNTKVTAIDATLPAAANGQAQVQIRIITTNAGGNDEWIGIDDIVVSEAPVGAGAIQFSAPTASVNENSGPVLQVTVTRSGGSSGAVSANFALGNVTTEGADYGTATVVGTGSTTTVSWADGDTTSRVIEIPIVSDADGAEGDETFTVSLSGATGGASLGSNNPITVTIVNDDPTYFAINGTTSFTEDWTAPNPVVANDNWDFTGSVIGYLGDFLTTGTTSAPGADPSVYTGETNNNTPAGPVAIDVIANVTGATAPNTNTSGGVAEFEGLANPTIALQGSGTADAPNLIFHIDATAVTTAIRVQYDVRDIDGSADNAIQSVALQYRVGDSGPFINVPSAFIADATTGGTATQVTSIDAFLPTSVNGQANVQIRVITADAAGSDEWVGIDNVVISQAPNSPGILQLAATSYQVNETAGTVTVTLNRTGGVAGAVSADFTITNATTNGTQGAADYGTPTPTTTVSWADGDGAPKTIVVPLVNDAVDENLESFVVTLTTAGGGAVLGANTVANVLVVDDDVTYFNLSGGSFTQDWTTNNLPIDDAWSNVASIQGFRGDSGLTAPVDPRIIDSARMLSSDIPAGVIDVNSNQTDPNGFFTGGVAYFSGANVGNNPTIAINGSATASAPFVTFFLNTTGVTGPVTVQYNLRDLDGSTDNAVQPVTLQYRLGTTGVFVDVPAAYVSDATTGPSLATLVTPVSVTFPTELSNQAQVQLRIQTGDATGNDEWVGIDDIVISSADTVAPTVSSINRVTASPSNAASVQWTVVFSESVTGVDVADFALATSGVTGASITSVTGSGTTYTVTANTGSGDGTIGLNLVDDDTIADTAGNLLGGTGTGNGNFTGQVYSIDKTTPSTTSFVRQTPSAATTNADSVVFRATFSEAVTGVGAADFAVNSSSTATVTAVNAVSATQYDVTVSGGNLASFNGSVGLNFAASPTIADLAGNAVPNTEPSTDEVYTLDNTAPTVTITDNVSGGPITVGTVITYTLTFSEGVTGVEVGDLSNNGTATGSFANFTAVNATTYTVQYTPTAAGTVILRVSNAGAVIQDTATNPLATPVNDDTTITVNAAANNGVFQFSSATYTTAEGVGTFSVTVTRTSGSTGSVNVPFTVTAGTATTPGDFTTVTASPLVFADSVTSQTIVFTVVDDGSGEANQDFSVALGTPTLGTLGAISSTTVTITDPLLVVSSLTQTESGVVVNFNRAYFRATDVTGLNLYDGAAGTLGAPDVTLTGDTVGAQRGSLVLKSANSAYFVRTGAVLPVDTYDLTLRSAANGFRDLAGVLLDGDNNAVAGGDYDPAGNELTVTSSSIPVVGVVDFTRGPTQTIAVPATAAGLPVTISSTTVNGNGIAAVDASVVYDPTLTTITGMTTPISGWTATINPNFATLADGRKVARFTVNGPTVLSGTAPLTIGFIQSNVPSTATYGAKEALQVQDVILFDNVTTLDVPGRGEDAVHIAAYFADTNGSQTITGGDAALVSQLAVGTGTGFAAYQLADPVIVADTNLSGTITGGDASLISQKAVGLTVAGIPDAGPAGNPVFGADPRLSIGNITGAAGSTVTVPINFLATEEINPGLSSIQVSMSWDPNKFSYVGTATLGSYLAGLNGWAFGAQNIDNANGTARIVFITSNPQAITPLNAGGEAFTVQLQVNANTTPGNYKINLRENVATTFTLAENNNGALLLVPQPTNADTDSVDGTFTVTAAATPTAKVFIPNQNVTAGATVTVPFNVTFANATTDDLASIQAAISWDPAVFQVSGTPTLGAFISGLPGWAAPTFNLDNANGTLRIVTNTSNPADIVAGTTGTVFNIPFTVAPTASGTSTINVREFFATTPTLVEYQGGVAILPLSPAPTNGSTDSTIDSVVTISVDPNDPPFNTIPTAQTYLTKPGAGGSNLVFSTANGNAITVSDPDANGSNLRTTLTVANGTLTLSGTTGLTVTGNGTGNLVATGTITDLNAALDGLTFTPTAGFYGTTAIQMNTNDLGNSGFGGPTFDIDSIAVTPVGVFISEVLFQDSGSQTSTTYGTLVTQNRADEYIEIFSTLPNYELPSDLYFVGIEGDSGAAGATGNVQDVFPLGGLQTGANGYLILTQRTNPYNSSVGVNANATLLANTGTGGGWGNGATSNIGGKQHSGANRVGEIVTDAENGSVTYMLVQAAAAPATANDIDADNDGNPDGTVFAGWTVLDAVGTLDGNAAADRSYGLITFRNGTQAAAGSSPTSITVQQVAFNPAYVGRVAAFKGWQAADWVASSLNATGSATYDLGTNVSNANYASRPLNHLGAPNYWTTTVNVTVNDGSFQRSQITRLISTFTSPVDLPVGWETKFALTVSGNPVNLVLTPLDGTDNLDGSFTGVTTVLVQFASTSGRTTTLTNGDASEDYSAYPNQPANPVSLVSLNDGSYTLTIDGTGIIDSFGVDVDGNLDGTFGGTKSFGFTRKFGDATGDGVVDNLEAPDFSNASLTYNGNEQGNYLWYFDFDGNGLIDSNDDDQFSIRYS